MNEDKSARYHRLRRRATVLSTALSTAFLLVFLTSGWSARLRDAAASWSGDSFPLTVVAYTLGLLLFSELIQLPIAFYEGITLERRYGLSTQTTAHWWKEHAKSLFVTAVFAVIAALLVLGVLRLSPQHWWIIGAASFSAILVLLAQIAPVVLLPLFYEVKPLQREALVQRLLVLADRARARVVGVFEWRVSDRTRKANAALAGIGRTRRILLSDTLLSEHSDDEIEVILAHELAHHVHHDICSAIAIETMLIFTGFYAAHVVLGMAGTSFGLTGAGDVAVLPLILLAAGAVSLLLMPVFNAVSRRHERRADRYALEMTRNPAAFVSAMKRLGAQNLAEERPSRLIELLFHSHPPLAKRVEAARAWAERS